MGKTKDQLVATLRKNPVERRDESSDGANLVAYRALFGPCIFADPQPNSLTIWRPKSVSPRAPAGMVCGPQNEVLDFPANPSLMASRA